MGGTISFLYAGTFPERVSKLGADRRCWPARHGLLRRAAANGKVDRRSTRARPPPFSRVHQRRRRRQPIAPNQSALDIPNLALDLARAGMKQNDKGKWVWKFDPLHRTARAATFLYRAGARIFPPHRVPGSDRRRQGKPPDTAHRQTGTLRRHRESSSHHHRQRRPHGASGQPRSSWRKLSQLFWNRNRVFISSASIVKSAVRLAHSPGKTTFHAPEDLDY